MDLLNTAIALTVTAAGILVIKKMFDRHITPRGHMLMWVLLLVVCLFSYGNGLMPESALSLRNLIPQISSEVTLETPESAPQNSLSQAGPQHTELPPEADGQSAEQAIIRTAITARMPFTGQIIEREYYETRQENQARRGNWHLPYLLTVLAAWGLLAAAVIRQNRRIEALPDVDPQTEEGMRVLEILQEMKEKAEVTADIRLKTGVQTTVLARVRRPVICLEEGFCEEELRHVFAHELTHYKHGDLWLSELFAWGACMYWWNPVLWLSFRRFRHDQEVYCDYDAAQLAGDRRAYARLLVSAAGQNRFLIGTTSFLGGEKEVSRRVKFLAAFKKPKTWICTLATAALIVCGVGLALNPKEGGLAVQGLNVEDVTDVTVDYYYPIETSEYGAVERFYLTEQETDELVNALHSADLTEMEQQVRADMELELWDDAKPEILRIFMERKEGGTHIIHYKRSPENSELAGTVLIGLNSGDSYRSEDEDLILTLEQILERCMDQPRGELCEENPFENRTFKAESHPYIPDYTLIYKTPETAVTDSNYLRIYGSGTYTFQDSRFIVENGENNDWIYENVCLTRRHFDAGGQVYVDASERPARGIAAEIDAPYTEYTICSETPSGGTYRIFEIQREGQDGEGDYREYWLAYYFEGTCQHIFYVGREYAITATYEIAESLTLVERLQHTYSNGEVELFVLEDEEAGETIQLYPGGYADFVKAVDENHLIFYLHGQNPISESYNKFPYLLHLVREDRSSDVFEQYREAICFPLDEVTVNGKQADCHLDDMQFTEDGIELAVTPDPANPMSFYVAYADMVWTRVSYDVQQKALRLTTRSITSVNEEMLNQLQVPEDHPYIEGFAVERKESGAEILLYLKDAARGYYAESDAASNPDRPVLKLRLTSEEGVRY